MSLRAVDLNLLTLFDAIHKARSLTRAAEKTGMSQPAMSRALSRMRHLFNDPLFLRDGRSIQPTPRADELALDVDRILRDLDETLRGKPGFDCARSTREFNLMLTDYGEMVLLPLLMERLEALKATVRVNVIAQNHAEAAELLHFGKVDFYFWAPPVPERGFRSQLVINEELWCLVRSNGKSRRRRLSLPQYLGCRTSPSTGRTGRALDPSSTICRTGACRAIGSSACRPSLTCRAWWSAAPWWAPCLRAWPRVLPRPVTCSASRRRSTVWCCRFTCCGTAARTATRRTDGCASSWSPCAGRSPANELHLALLQVHRRIDFRLLRSKCA
ncbi:MAG TPA: LysR family transcriptional regulator [Variovorax sp.]|nr:LysR family transcriptional regulator [Variovorax sp.]